MFEGDDFYGDEIDIFRDGVYATSNKLLQKAYDGEIMEGAFDWPASCGVSKINKEFSDMHVEFCQELEEDYWENEPADMFSEVRNIAPATLAKEPGPSDTTTPFSYPEGESSAPGMFGKALRSFTEAVAVIIAQNEPVEDLIELFCRLWGLDQKQKESIVASIPNTRSQGVALWGGYQRILRPITYAYGATQAGLKVVFHGVTRQKFGEDAIVDWPRIEATVRTIVGQVMVDDRKVKVMPKRMDFAIVPYEVPEAPKVTKMKPIRFKCAAENNAILSGAAQAAFNYIANCRKKNLESMDIVRKTKLTLTVQTQLPAFSAGFVHIDRTLGAINLDVLHNVLDDDVDLMQITRAPQLVTNKRPTGMTVFKSIVEAAIRKNLHVLPRAYEVHEAVAALDIPQKQAAATKLLSHTIKVVVDKDAFTMLAAFGNLVEKGLGRLWVIKVADEIGLDKGIFRNTGYKHILSAGINSEKGIIGFGILIQRLIHTVEMNVTIVFTRQFLLDMANSGSLIDSLDLLFNRRKRYWKNRYKRKARMYVQNILDKNVKECVKYQLLSKSFDMAEFVINEEHEVKWQPLPIRQVLCSAAHKFATKRMKKTQNPQDLLEPSFGWAAILRGELDDWVKQQCNKVSVYPYVDAANDIRYRLDEFVQDIRDIYRRIITNDAVDLSELPVEDEPDEDLNVEEEVIEPVVMPPIRVRADFEDVAVVNPVKEADPTAQKISAVCDFDDDDDMGDNGDVEFDEDGNAIYYYILRSDLYDDIPRITERVINELVIKYGEQVPMSEMDQVKKDAGALATRYAAEMQHADLDVPDLE